MKWIDLEPLTTIEDAAIAVVTTANHTGDECRANFNGYELAAQPLVTDEDELIQAYYQHCAGNDPQERSRPGDELGAEVILITVGLLRDCLLYGFGEDEFERFKDAARSIVAKAQLIPESGGSPIKAARDIYETDRKFGNRLTNVQKAMLFIAAIELMQETAAGK